MAYKNNGLMVKHVNDLITYWDYEKNSSLKLNPEVIPVHSSVTTHWRCPNGHKWEEKVSTMYRRKHKCFYCSGRLVVPGYNDLKTLYPDIAAEWDIESNVITPDKVSPKDTNSYYWRCINKHPRFKRSVEHRVIRKDVCPYCTGRKVATGFNDIETLYPKLVNEWDYEGNNGLLPSQVSSESGKEYKWICPKEHHYSMKVKLRTHSTKLVDCPICNKSRSTSFPEQAIFYYCKKFFPDAISRYKGLSKNGLELDIYLPRWKIGIEYDGKYSHSSSEAKEREKRKYIICQSKNIKLIRIKEDEREDWYNESADEVYYVKKRPNDMEMNDFLYFFFSRITSWSNTDPLFLYKLPTIINIKRDRPEILEYLIDIENSFGSLYPDLAKNWDKKANGKLTPYMLSPGSTNFPITFICERCKEHWVASIHTVVKWNRTLCKKCSMSDNGVNNTKRIVAKRGSLGEKFKEAVEQWDYVANGDLTPFDIPAGYSKPVNWKCPVCSYKWSSSPNSRIHKNVFARCPHCVGRVAMPGVDDLETLYPNIAKEWDYEKNGDVLPSQIRPFSGIPRYWMCPIHNIGYKALPGNRIKHICCPKCKAEKIKERNGFKVEQYTKDLKYIRTFASLSEAGNILNTSPNAIRQAVLKGAVSNDSYWKYEGTEFGHLRPDKKHEVIAINVKSGLRTEYESAREAERQICVGHTKIMNCCKKKPKYKTAGGYYWYFKGEEPSF